MRWKVFCGNPFFRYTCVRVHGGRLLRGLNFGDGSWKLLLGNAMDLMPEALYPSGTPRE